MDNYFNQEELKKFAFAKMGDNIKISKSARLYDTHKMEFGNNVRIDDFCLLSGKLVFENNIHITPYCCLAGGDEGIYFSDFTAIAYRVTIFTRSDDYNGDTMVGSMIPETLRFNTIRKPVHLGKHVVIGTNTIVLPGCDIGEGCSIGAMSLMTKPTEPWGVYWGIPAKRYKERSKKMLEQEKKYFSEESA